MLTASESRRTRKKIWKLYFKNQGCNVWNWQIWQVLGCSEHGNETCELHIKYLTQELLVSQDEEIFLKHPVLLNMCHYTFVHSISTESFERYINDLHFHFLSLNITSFLIDFMFCRRQHPWRNSKTNGRITPSTQICCKQSVPACCVEHRLAVAVIMVNVTC